MSATSGSTVSTNYRQGTLMGSQQLSQQAQPPRVYSYIRFSTPEQRGGDSLRRQTAGAAAWASQHGLELDSTLRLTDEGLSAFRGKHVAEGRLGAFLKEVKEGNVPQGSVLLVESLDRLSRQDIRTARNLLEEILDAGVDVVAGGHWFKRDKYELTDMIVALVGFSRATEESETKAKRLRAVWVGKRERARETGTAMTGKVPAWLKREGEGFRVIEDRATVVRRIFDLARRGVGMHGIVRRLTEEQVPTFGKSKWWQRSAVAKLLANPAAVGTLVPHEVMHEGGKRVRRPVGEPIEGYYPAVVSKAVWDATQLYRGSRNTVPAGGPARNLFGGILRCARCGATITRRDKGARSKPKLVCERARRSGWKNGAALPGGACDAPTMDYEAFERRMLESLPGLLENVTFTSALGLGEEMDEVEAEIKGCDLATDRILSAVERGSETRQVQERLVRIQKERDTLTAKLAKLQAEASRRTSPAFHRVLTWLGETHDLLTNRGAAALKLRTIISAVRVDTKARVATIDWTGGEADTADVKL